MKLKRKKKITKRELRRDPFVEFVNNLYEQIKEKPLYYLGGFVLFLLLIGGAIFLKSSGEKDYPLARQMWFQAVTLIQAQRMNEASKVLQDLSLRFPDSPEGKKALYYLGSIAFYQGDYVNAKTRYESYLSRKPKDPLLKPAAEEALGVIDFIMGNTESGIKRIKKAIKEVPYKTFKDYFTLHLIKLLLQKEKYKEAYEILESVKKDISPSFKVEFSRIESFLKGALQL